MTALAAALPPSSALSMARGACPALSAPMLTGDGYLSRVALTDGVTPAQLSALCTLSKAHGNGILDITARGNLQVRGLTVASAELLEQAVRSLALPLREGLAVEWSPLAGLDPAETTDPRTLGEAIIASARVFEGQLAPKLSVVLESGGQIRLDHLLADIRLSALSIKGDTFWRLTLGGTAATGRTLGVVSDRDAAEVTQALLSHLAELGPRARARDIEPAHLPASLLEKVTPVEPSVTAISPAPFGLFALEREHHALRLALAFGQVTAETLHRLVDKAGALGVTHLRPAPNHALIAFAPEPVCRELLAMAEDEGFITSTGDPLADMSACPGAPACQSGRIETHALGRFAADQASGLFDGSLHLHISGCAKGCAHPTPASLTFAAMEDATHLVFAGKTTDTPLKRLAPRTEAAALTALSALLRLERQPGETSRDCLQRLGPERIAAALV
ncbi:precorrin-3B synthase [Rhizobium sp. FY34]|uniref:precorrin-3B synthase n=1 Tax=Rhizobium sp. FY34 TaxID=2562309 RepID=UPI001484FE8A|nr:precorrin-3B synthase [Rhizobium sp. FY34]